MAGSCTAARGSEVKPHYVLHVRASRFVGGPERQILRYAKLTEGAGIVTTIATFLGDRSEERRVGKECRL